MAILTSGQNLRIRQSSNREQANEYREPGSVYHRVKQYSG